MTFCQTGDTCRECQARGEWFSIANLLFGEVSGVGMCSGTPGCLPYFRPVSPPGEGRGEREGRKAALTPAWLGVAFPGRFGAAQEPGQDIPGSPGRNAAGCGGRGGLLVMSHTGAGQDAVCGSRGDAEREREEGQSRRKQ